MGTGEIRSLGHKSVIEAGWCRDVFINWFRIPLPKSVVKLTQQDLDKIRRLGPLSEPFDGVYNRLKPAQVRIGAPSLSPSPSPSPSPISSA